MRCLYCKYETLNPKFCSRSCSASFNNRGIRRHGNKPGNCITCGIQRKPNGSKKFCSRACQKTTAEHKRSLNAANQSKYRQKKYRKIHSSANSTLIKEFYKNKPNGYEVDHIIPLSKGGLHHQDNLQYLLKKDNRKKGSKLVGTGGTAPPSYGYEPQASL